MSQEIVVPLTNYGLAINDRYVTTVLIIRHGINTLKKGTKFLESSGRSLPSVLAHGKLHVEQRYTTHHQHDEIRDEKRSCNTAFSFIVITLMGKNVAAIAYEKII